MMWFLLFGCYRRSSVMDAAFVGRLPPFARTSWRTTCRAAESSHRVLLGSRGSIAVPKLPNFLEEGNQSGADLRFEVVYIGTAKTAPRADSLRPLKEQRKKRRWEARRKARELSETLNNARWSALFLEDYHDKANKLAKDIVRGFSKPKALDIAQRVLIVDGGNTYWLWYHAQKAGLQEALGVVKAERPFMYFGLSAGAILAGRTCRTADWKGWDDPSVVPSDAMTTHLEGLSLVDAAIFAHHGPEWEDLVQKSKPTLPEGCALICVGEEDLQEHAWTNHDS